MEGQFEMRIWFEPLPYVRTRADCHVLNRAVRNFYPVSKHPSHADLVLFATSYVKGMSAAELIEVVEDKLASP